MSQRIRASHSISGLFAFLLLGLFAIFSTVMVLLGARAYRGVTDTQHRHNAERIAPAYLRSMVRGADEQNVLRVEAGEDGSDMLVIEQTYDDELATTYIYCHEGVLRERFISADVEFRPEDGEEVCALQGLKLNLQPGLLEVRLLHEDHTQSMNIALYSALYGDPMKSGNRSNALLVELLIVIMFFMLASTVLLQVFVSAQRQADASDRMITGLNDAQDIIDRLYAADDPNGVLTASGYACDGETGVWVLPAADGAGETRVKITEEKTASGRLAYFDVSVLDGEQQPLVTLKNARYQEATP